jgi:hypothetical protein
MPKSGKRALAALGAWMPQQPTAPAVEEASEVVMP